MKTQRVLFVSGAANLGGLQSSTHTRIKALMALGIQCEKLFLKSGAGKETYADVPTYITKRPKRIEALLRSQGYTAISLINRTDVLESLRRVQFRGQVIFEVRGKAKHALEVARGLTAQDVGSIVVISRYVEKLVRQALQTDDIPIHVVYNAVDTDLFTPLRDINEKAIPYSHDASRRPVILWVGRLSSNKNYPEMLTIARMLLQGSANPPVFWVVSDTQAKDNASAFWEHVRSLDLEPHVRLLPCVPHRSMVHVYNLVARSRGCVLSTSLSEGFQNSLLEGMACGVPVISAAVGGNVELVADGINGRLYPLGRPDQAVAIIRELLGDPLLWSFYARAGLARIQSHHTPQRHAAAFLTALENTPVMAYKPLKKPKTALKKAKKTKKAGKPPKKAKQDKKPR